MNDIWAPLWLSLRIATIATVITAAVGVPLAYIMARHRFAGRSVIDAMILVPLVMPPTVVGYFILMVFGARAFVGRWLERLTGGVIIFRIQGAILAAAIVALPMLYMPAKSAFAAIEREMEEISRLMGANRLQVFWYVSLPLARRGVASGLLLAFARAIGEFGATIMVLGWQPSRLTLPISIYTDYEQDALSHATWAVVALSLASMGLVMAYNWTSAGKQD